MLADEVIDVVALYDITDEELDEEASCYVLSAFNEVEEGQMTFTMYRLFRRYILKEAPERLPQFIQLLVCLSGSGALSVDDANAGVQKMLEEVSVPEFKAQFLLPVRVVS